MAQQDYSSVLGNLVASGSGYGTPSDEAYGKLIASGTGVAPTQGITPVPVVDAQIKDNNQAIMDRDNKVGILTEQLRPQAATFNGQMVLQQMLGNSATDPNERAAAAQALNPGLKAQVTADGTLAFSAAPGADLGFNYPNAAKQATQTNNAGSFKKATNAQEDFNKTYTSILGMDDPNEIANSYASLRGSVAEFAGNKRKALEASVGQSMGLAELERKMAADKIADQEFYNTYYNGQNLGPTDESLQTISLYNQKRTQVEQEVAKRFNEDPEVAAMTSRMQSLGVLVENKNKDIFNHQSVKDAEKGSLIPEDMKRNAAVALGQDYDNLTDNQKAQLGIQIPTNPFYKAAAEIGGASASQIALYAITGTGDSKTMADRVLKQRLSDAPQYEADIKQAFADFDKPNGLGSTLKAQNKEAYKANYEVPITITSAKDKAVVQQQINANKMSAIMQDLSAKRDAAFSYSVGSWDKPQDPTLQEVPTIIENLKARKQPVTIDAVIAGLNMSGPGDRTATINALTTWITSQAASLPGSKFFGTSAMYSNPDITKGWVQTRVVAGSYSGGIGNDMFGEPTNFGGNF